MIKAHRIRLNPTAEQDEYFRKASGTRRFVYNWGLAEWKRQYEAGEKLSAFTLKKQFNALKGEQFPWVYDVTKCAVEGAFMDLANAFTHFFAGRKAGRKVGYPKFKAKKRSREGFYVDNEHFSVSGHWLKLPHIGRVNMTEKLRWAGKLLSARITRTAQWWFVSLTVELPDVGLTPPSAQVGIDLGINRLATLSDGQPFENQKPLRTLLRKLAHAQRDLSRKQPGSRNRDKARLKVARLYYRIACIRADHWHKVTTHIAQQYGFVAVETLHVKGMLHNRSLAQAHGDAAFGLFRTFLISKVECAGGVVQPLGRFFPSSKTCSACGQVKDTLSLAERVYHCEQCGMTLDRDLNAALNILHEGQRLRAASFRCTVSGTGLDET